MPPLSHLTSYTPTKSNLYLANSLAAAVSEPSIYRLLTFHIQNLMPIFRSLYRSEYQSRSEALLAWFRSLICFYGDVLLAPSPTPKLDGHPLSAVRDCLFNIFTSTLRTGACSSIRKLRTCHAIVTGTQFSWNCTIDICWKETIMKLCILIFYVFVRSLLPFRTKYPS